MFMVAAYASRRDRPAETVLIRTVMVAGLIATGEKTVSTNYVINAIGHAHRARRGHGQNAR
ncbi:hypothetical protein ACQP1V_34470 [Microtetraspora malaysiensis]|uniref:hypothetical protein n=1 Tax=Microtetraspora malaysiensis TaxID=161358 RepID=UPI003D90DC66